MQLILLGPPGSGKGTLAGDLARQYQIPHISTGDIFRQNIQAGTPLGQQASQYLSTGALVPDELTIALIEDRLGQSDCAGGFLLDGFPRTLPQAEALDRIMQHLNKSLTAVINLQVSDETIISRLSGRRLCSGCGRGYNLKSIPPRQEGICDVCGQSLIQRADDQAETVLKRLATYARQTEPLISHYRARRQLIDIDNEGSISACSAAVSRSLANWAELQGL
jgi:adenylate kinase